MKKGFTVVELIISISLLLLVVTVPLVFYHKNSNNNKIKEFNEIIESSARVYLEGIKFDENILQIKNPNDYIYLKISDLINAGLIDEKIYNPLRNANILETLNDCFKIYMTEDNIIKVDYPVNECSNIPVIHLHREESQFVLEDSYTVFEWYKEDPEIINDIQNGFPREQGDSQEQIEPYFAYYDGALYTGFKEYLEVEYRGYSKLTDYKGDIINTKEEDWDISYEWNGEKREWYVTYEINSESEIYKSNTDYIGKIEPKILTIKLVDEDAPILINKNNDLEYNSELIYLIRNNNQENYYKFDNFDGYTSNPLEIIYNKNHGESNLNFQHVINLEDTAKNSRKYSLNINYIHNTAPEVEYIGDEFFECIDLESHDFSSYITCRDYENDECTIDYEVVYEYTNTYFQYMYEETIFWSEQYDYDTYTLNIFANDEYGGEVFSAYILETLCYQYYEESLLEDEDYSLYDYDNSLYEDNYTWSKEEENSSNNLYCDDPCIIEMMKQNSYDWHYADEEEKNRLHGANDELSKQLSYEVTYDDKTGYWYDSDNNILYD